MGIEGLAKYLNLSKSTVYKLAQEGSLPSQKVGKHWRFRQETVNRWLDGELPSKHLTDGLRPAVAKAPVVAASAGEALLIACVDRFTEAQISQLKSRWIETVDQFFSIASTPAGATGLAALLELSDIEFVPWLAGFEAQILSAAGDAPISPVDGDGDSK